MKFICEQCGVDIIDMKHRRKFCSQDCRAKAWRGSANPAYRGGCLRKDGYKVIYVEGVQILEHRHLMENLIGRKLKSTEVVHHIDGDPTNNEIGNLMLVTRGSHRRIHSRVFRSETHKECTLCHSIKPRSEFPLSKSPTGWETHNTRCKDCHNTYQRESRRQKSEAA